MLVSKRAGREQNGGGVRRKKERGEGRKDGKNMYTLLYSVADILENKTPSACFEQRRVNGEVEENEHEDDFHRFPYF